MHSITHEIAIDLQLAADEIALNQRRLRETEAERRDPVLVPHCCGRHRAPGARKKDTSEKGISRDELRHTFHEIERQADALLRGAYSGQQLEVSLVWKRKVTLHNCDRYPVLNVRIIGGEDE